MSYKLARCDIRFLKVMYKVGNALAILPLYSFEKCALVSPSLNKLYACLFLIFEILCTTWIIYLRNSDDNIHFFTITFQLLGTCDNLILSMLKATLILNLYFFKQNEWVKFNNKFQLIDQRLNIKNRSEKNMFKNSYFQFGVCNILYLSFIIYTIAVRVMEKGLSTLKLFVLHELTGYYSFYVQILLWNIALAFRARCKCVNEQLFGVIRRSAKKNLDILNEIGKNSRLLGEMVGLFNDLFGLPLVFVTGRCVIKILGTLNFFTNTLHIHDTLLRNRLVISSLGQTVAVLLAITILILSCDSAEFASKKGVLLCYKLREKFPRRSEEQKELLELAEIMEKHTVNFTAAGFFDINRATLFGILGTTTTYLIVTIQFNQSLKNA